MKITVINGTEIKGCTYHIKEEFLAPLRDAHEITEFYLPRDMPHFCRGCKRCFFEDAALCPHAAQVEPIWTALLDADLIVIAAPVYGLSIPAGLKALLDHFCVRWMVHRPEPAMFAKRAVVMTNCVGMPFMAKSSQKDAVSALSWMGVSEIKRHAVGLLEGVVWEELSAKRRDKIESQARKLGMRYTNIRPAGKSLKVRVKFFICKLMHGVAVKKEEQPSADNRHWIEQGWIKGNGSEQTKTSI